MSYSFQEFKRKGAILQEEHANAIDAAETAGERLAIAEAAYHRELAVTVGVLKAQHGSTIAETLAKGDKGVSVAKEERDIAAARDRAAMERVRLCRDDRAVLLTMASWSKAQEAFES